MILISEEEPAISSFFEIHLELCDPGTLIMQDLYVGVCAGSDFPYEKYCSAYFRKALDGWSNLLNISYSSKMTASMGWYTWYPLPDQRTVGSAVPNFSLNFLNVPFNARKWLFSLSNVPLSKSIKTKE